MSIDRRAPSGARKCVVNRFSSAPTSTQACVRERRAWCVLGSRCGVSHPVIGSSGCCPDGWESAALACEHVPGTVSLRPEVGRSKAAGRGLVQERLESSEGALGEPASELSKWCGECESGKNLVKSGAAHTSTSVTYRSEKQLGSGERKG